MFDPKNNRKDFGVSWFVLEFTHSFSVRKEDDRTFYQMNT